MTFFKFLAEVFSCILTYFNIIYNWAANEKKGNNTLVQRARLHGLAVSLYIKIKISHKDIKISHKDRLFNDHSANQSQSV